MCLENILFVSRSINKLTPSVFNTWFSFSSDQHNYETSSFRQGNLIKSSYRTNRYGKYSIIASTIDSWNKIQKNVETHYWKIYPPITLKQFLALFILNHTPCLHAQQPCMKFENLNARQFDSPRDCRAWNLKNLNARQLDFQRGCRAWKSENQNAKQLDF